MTRMLQKNSQSFPEPEILPFTQIPVDAHGIVMLSSVAIQIAWSHMLWDTGAVSRARYTTPHQVLVGVQELLKLHVNPIAGLRQAGFINGQFTLYGDMPLAIIEASQKLDDIDRFLYVLDEVVAEDGSKSEKIVRRCIENNNVHRPARGACVRVLRRGHETPIVVTFDEAEARKAGLWENSPVWKRYPSRMLLRRAESQALHMAFSDVLNGAAIAEYDAINVPIKKEDLALRDKQMVDQLAQLVSQMKEQQSKKGQGPEGDTKKLDEVQVHDPFANIETRHLRTKINTPEARAEFERRKIEHYARLAREEAEHLQIDAEKESAEAQGEPEAEGHADEAFDHLTEEDLQFMHEDEVAMVHDSALRSIGQ